MNPVLTIARCGMYWALRIDGVVFMTSPSLENLIHTAPEALVLR